MTTPPTEFRGAKVLVVSPVSGGSYPISRCAAEAFTQLGAEVRFVDFSWLTPPESFHEAASRPEALSELVSYASALVRHEAEQFRPDLCFVLAQAPIDEATVRSLRANGVVTAFWFVENYRLTRYWSQVAPVYDWFFTVQRGAFHDALSEIGCRNQVWLPLAASPHRHRPRRVRGRNRARFESDVSFAGYGYYNRREMLGGLADFDFRIWGPGWEGSSIEHLVQNDGKSFDEAEFARIAACATIHVNLHSAAHLPGVDPDGDYLNPRTFELAALGAFQLVDRRRDLPEHFDAPSELVTFDDLASLRAKVRYFLDHESERIAVSRRARRRVLSEHTYRHRMLDVLTRTLTQQPVVSCRTSSIDGFPRLSDRSFESLEDFSDLVRAWSLEPVASDDELLLRMAMGGKLDS